MSNLSCQRHLFSLDPDQVYLNNAYMSPLLKTAEEEVMKHLYRRRQPNVIKSSDFFSDVEKSKALFAKLINVRDKNDICIIGGTSYGIASVAKNVKIKEGQYILTIQDQFPSNYYSWQRVCEEKGCKLKVVRPESGHNRGQLWNEKIISSITDDVRVVTMCHAHWADGTLFDLVKIRERCDEVGAYLIIDGTQSIGAMPFDNQQIGADAVIVSAYKWLFGPYGMGVAYFGDKFKNGTPIEESWLNRLNSDDFTGLVNYESRYRLGAQRYSVAEHCNFPSIGMLNHGLRHLLEWNPVHIQKYARALLDSIKSEIEGLDFWIEDEKYRCNHLFGVKVPPYFNINDLKEIFNLENISVSYRGNYIRISISVYNTKNDLNLLLDCLRESLKIYA